MTEETPKINNQDKEKMKYNEKYCKSFISLNTYLSKTIENQLREELYRMERGIEKNIVFFECKKNRIKIKNQAIKKIRWRINNQIKAYLDSITPKGRKKRMRNFLDLAKSIKPTINAIDSLQQTLDSLVRDYHFSKSECNEFSKLLQIGIPEICFIFPEINEIEIVLDRHYDSENSDLIIANLLNEDKKNSKLPDIDKRFLGGD
jgi:hypothetical protein